MLLFKKYIKYLIYVFLAPVVFFIHFLRPFKCIKLCELNSDRFPPFIATIEGFLYDKNNTQKYKNCIIFFYYQERVANRQAKIMAERHIRISSHRIVFKLLSQAIIFWGKKSNHILKLLNLPELKERNSIPTYIHWVEKGDRETSWYKHGKTSLCFNSEEEQRGLQLLTKLGVEPGCNWICIQNRDSAYLDKANPKQGSKKMGDGDWSYHNHRDSSINSMVEAAQFLTSRDYYVLRMGKFVNEKLITNNSKIIDYANSELRDDFLDLYLLANCKTIIGGDSGITEVPYYYKKPVHFSNMVFPFYELTWFCPWLIIFKRIKDLKTGKLLSIKEILNSDFANTKNKHEFDEHNVALVENTSEDIKSLAVEIVKEFQKEPIEDKEDLKIQKEFWKLYYQFANKEKIGSVRPRISSSYLRKNLDLLN